MGFLAPTSKITPDDYNYLVCEIKDPGVVTDDGTIYGTAKYEQLDPDWIYAALNYGINKLDPSSIHEFGTTPHQGQLLTSTSGTNVDATIALVGDWGTGAWDEDGDGGKGAAYAVMEQIKSLNPAYVIHLRDVYYAGTDLRPPPGEEQTNFINMWTEIWGTGDSDRFFTLNSNHEMYGDASGYFDIALAADGPFGHQNQTSYFVLQNDDWAILGLDAAYYSQSTLYMEGNLYEGSNTSQLDFVQGLDLSGKRVIALTHQTGMDYSGTTPSSLWTNDMKTALGGNDPDFWYWGHIHNGIVYTDNSAAGTMVARCVGHGAIPFGSAWGLAGSDKVAYYPTTPNSAGSIRVRNGFAMLTLLGSTLKESFYEQGVDTPMWTATFSIS